MDRKEFGRRLRAARKGCGLTGEQLAELCSINPTYLRQLEAGTKLPSLPMFVLLCQKLQISPDYLLGADCSPSELAPLRNLCQKATPIQLRMITAMVQGALSAMDESTIPGSHSEASH